MANRALRINEAEETWPQEDHLRLLVESVQDYAIFMLDPEGNVVTWSAGGERMKGYEAREIIGRHFSVFYPPGPTARARSELALRVAAEAGRYEDEGHRARKDGSLFWANVTMRAMRDADGKLVGFAKITRDLTERRRADERLRQEQERFRLLVESVKDYAVIMLDPAGNVATWNPGAERMFGFSSIEIAGHHISRLCIKEDVRAGRCERHLDAAARDGRTEDECVRVRKDGSQICAKVQTAALHDSGGRLLGFAHIAQDLTEPRKAEEARLRLLQAKEAIRLRDEFLSIASHELKTPLTALQLQLQSLTRKLTDSDASIRRKADQAIAGASRLAHLVDELLDVSRISTGRLSLNLQQCDLVACAREVIEQFSESAAAADCAITLRAESPVIGTWDKVRMEQVITNLLSNAAKYGAHSPVEVSVWSEPRCAVMEVVDEGPGIPPDHLSRIFERFERAHSVRQFGGLGLGLYLARQIAEAHGGSISARNWAGRGACLTVRVPTSPPVAAGRPGDD